MGDEKKPYHKSFRYVAVMAVFTFTLLLDQTVRAGQFRWSVMIAQAAAGASVAQLETEPEAIFTITPENPVLGVPFRVDASQSFDRPSADPIANYLWNWGDGSDIGNGVTLQHTYSTSGRFTITLTVYDADTPPNSNSSSLEVVIDAGSTPPPGGGNKAPTASLVITPVEGFVGEEFTFNASGSRDADGDPLVYRFSFGDGEETEFSSDSIVTHQYDQAGNFSVRLTVRDDHNASGDINGSVVVLGPDAGNSDPVALIGTGPRTGAAIVSLNFDGSISYDPDGDSLIYEWTFSEDDVPYAVQNGAVVNQVFDQPGTYTVVLKVSDLRGGTDTSEAEVITITEGGEPVEPPPPAPVPTPEPPPPSYTQRPPSACGAGILMPMLVGLLGLMGKRGARPNRD